MRLIPEPDAHGKTFAVMNPFDDSEVAQVHAMDETAIEEVRTFLYTTHQRSHTTHTHTHTHTRPSPSPDKSALAVHRCPRLPTAH